MVKVHGIELLMARQVFDILPLVISHESISNSKTFRKKYLNTIKLAIRGRTNRMMWLLSKG